MYYCYLLILEFHRCGCLDNQKLGLVIGHNLKRKFSYGQYKLGSIMLGKVRISACEYNV